MSTEFFRSSPLLSRLQIKHYFLVIISLKSKQYLKVTPTDPAEPCRSYPGLSIVQFEVNNVVSVGPFSL